MEKQNLSIFNFSRFIFKICILLIGIGLLISFLFEEMIVFKSQISGASKVNRILSINKPNEIPIFGSSRAEGNFVPSLLDENCHNYGIKGSQANIWLFFLEQELLKNKNTPIIINFDLRGLVYSDGDISNYIPNWTHTKRILKNKGEYYYTIPFVKYFGEYEEYTKYFLNEKMNITKITDNGGSFENRKIITDFEKLVRKRENYESEFVLEVDLLKKFNRLIRKTKRTIIFVVPPYHKSNFKKFKNITQANEFLNSLKRNENLRVFDLRNFISSDELYVNTSHLNYKGAIKFTKKVKELLKIEGCLK